MLSVLDHKGLGDVVAVVIRYFGGIKLGAGGLVRAYAAAVQQAVDEMPLAWARPMHSVHLRFGFEHEDRVRRLVATHGGQLGEPDYSQSVEATVTIEESAWADLGEELTQATSGQIEMVEPE
jgi:putative IMPACT (imprinted ancient) family translation regulator